MKASQEVPISTSDRPERERWRLLLQDLATAIESARRRSLKVAAVRELREASESAQDVTAPYAPKAVALLERFHDLDSRDSDAVHHLAIAYHAMAWDLELRGDETASQAWRKALALWKKLRASPTFWRDLIARGEAFGPGFDAASVEGFRGRLVEELLEVHVELIGHYCERSRREDALRHVALIRQAAIPPAARRQFAGMVYRAMTPAGPAAPTPERLSDTLSLLEGFLGLFPDDVTALRTFLETTRLLLEQLPPAGAWERIVELGNRALPYWHALDASPRQAEDPLASASLRELAESLGKKFWSRARSLRSKREVERPPKTLDCDEYRAYEGTVAWLSRALRPTADDEIRLVLDHALLARAELKTYAGLSSDEEELTFRLLAEALSDCERATSLVEDDNAARKLAAQILQCRADRRLTDLVSGRTARSDFDSELKNIEEDLAEALRLDPENPSLEERLEEVRGFLAGGSPGQVCYDREEDLPSPR